MVGLYKEHNKPLMIAYYSGSGGNYLSKNDCTKVGLPIL